MRTVIVNIRKLVQVEHEILLEPRKGEAMKVLPSIDDAYLLIEDGKILKFGSMAECPQVTDKTIDAEGGMVFPSWCDSHTHLVFAGSREAEFVGRINGLSYQEIARKGGGILNSANRLCNTSEEELLESAFERLEEVIGYGTGAVEIKSGYGLTVAAELKILRVIQKLKTLSPIPIKATFLGAHAVPLLYKENRRGYIDLIINEMLPKVAEEGLADYIDVFCEKVAFSPKETGEIIQAGLKYGLKPKIHTNQFYSLGGIEVGVANGAISVDHLEVVNEEEIKCLQGSNTISTLLPSAPFFLNDHYPPARKILDAGLPVALATDYNPGSTPSGKMPFVVSLACIKMKMTPEEAINAATINGACAIELQHKVGSIAVGKRANLFITKRIPSIDYFPYAFGSDLIKLKLINGQVIS